MNEDLEKEVVSLLKKGESITAIKLTMERLRCGLGKAKEMVEEIIDKYNWKTMQGGPNATGKLQ